VNRNALVSLMVLVAALASAPARSQDSATGKPAVTIEDLVTYTHIRNVRLSPDGRNVSYLTVRPLLKENLLECTLWLQQAAPGSTPVVLARFQGTADQVWVETGELKHFGGQSAWSPDGRRLAYTGRAGDRVDVWLRDADGGGAPTRVADDYIEADLTGWTDDGSAIRFTTMDSAPRPAVPEDPSVLVTDDRNFFSASWPKGAPPERKLHHLAYNIAARALSDDTTPGKAKGVDSLPGTYKEAGWPAPPDAVKYILRPIPSPDRQAVAFTGVGLYNNRDPRRASRDYFIGVKRLGDSTPPQEFLHTPAFVYYFQWSGDGKQVYALQFHPEYTTVMAVGPERGEVREVARTSHFLMESHWDRKGMSFVAVRQSSFMPDELVRFDVGAKRFDVLASPNASFAAKDLPQVQFRRVSTPLGGGIFGRLVLPNGYIKGKRYPLVFTTYRAGTGFLAGAVGDEFPILPFAAHGFVVYAMDTGESNMLSESGDLAFTRLRERKPLEAMRVLRQELADEGIVDSTQCGVTGLSYGSDITSYAVATTRIFKAAAVSASDFDPTSHLLNSVQRETVLAKYGYPYPDEAGRASWREGSIALNADRVTTPLLIQSPESEAMFSLETFKALRHYGVPVEWYVYLNEGHQKFQPRSKYLVYQRNLDWMRFWLQGAEDDDPAKAEQFARWRDMRRRWEQRASASGSRNDRR